MRSAFGHSLRIELPSPRHLYLWLSFLILLSACSQVPSRLPPSATQAAETAFVWPVSGWITATDSYHTGVVHTLGSADIGTAYAQPVAAARAGRVAAAGFSRSPRFGYYVRVTHENGYETLYAHLLGAPSVKAGQRVGARQPLGYSGRTGNATLPHLHFAVLQDGNARALPGLEFGTWVNRGTALPGPYEGLTPMSVASTPFSVRVATPTLKLRKSAGTESSVLRALTQGEVLTVLGGDVGFYRVQTGALEGYVASSGVVPVDSPVYSVRTRASTEAYTAPDTAAEVMATFPQGTVLSAFASSRGFYKVQWRDADRFVHYVYIPSSLALKTSHFWVRGILDEEATLRRGPGTGYEAAGTLTFSPYTPEYLITDSVQGWYKIGPQLWLPGWLTLRF